MKTYLEARPTTNMKNGWIYRPSYDEKNEEIKPFDWDRGSSDDDDDPVMIQIKWWSRLDDDPVTIYIKCWSKLDDDLVMLQIKWWSRLDEDDLKMKMT